MVVPSRSSMAIPLRSTGADRPKACWSSCCQGTVPDCHRKRSWSTAWIAVIKASAGSLGIVRPVLWWFNAGKAGDDWSSLSILVRHSENAELITAYQTLLFEITYLVVSKRTKSMLIKNQRHIKDYLYRTVGSIGVDQFIWFSPKVIFKCEYFSNWNDFASMVA